MTARPIPAPIRPRDKPARFPSLYYILRKGSVITDAKPKLLSSFHYDWEIR